MEKRPTKAPLKWWQNKPSRGEIALAMFLLAVLATIVAMLFLVARTMGDRRLP